MTEIQTWIKEIEGYINRDEDISTESYADFIENPELALPIIDCIDELDEGSVEDSHATYTACVFILDVCVTQLQSAAENGNKIAAKTLKKLMSHMANIIKTAKHGLGFWLPILNAFYEVNVELADDLKSAYFELANQENKLEIISERSHLDSIREVILDLSDLSIYDIAENFFAQSSAMPEEFFIDLVLDLYSIEEGQEIALLSLLHPKPEVRDYIVAAIDSIIHTVTLSSDSLSRLQVIKSWYPVSYHSMMDNWIKIQRKKGVVFNLQRNLSTITNIQGTEIDGGGAQGIFMQIKRSRKNRLCGLLLKSSIGIKDAWMTPVISVSDIKQYKAESFDETICLRKIDLEYLELMANHFLAETLESYGMPDLHLLEIQEELGLNFVPKKIDVDEVIEKLGVLINPFTEEVVEASLKRSKNWLKTKNFAESWFIESQKIDRLVNQCSSFEDGVKVCRLQEAVESVFQNYLEQSRQEWVFHFLWVSLWAKSGCRENEKLWQDSFIIAYSINSGRQLNTIPLLQEICLQSVINSMKTMQERGTHLT
ncbi:MAG: hypothetical protein A3E88_00160 [Legionellales bacterium RIFCSPHIGHO2_12_FULL_35_11]|nr:MAG: hypothetical protein A3E88_00160 [Legionellales bacterium RIFCSPHIGHO2_12_FULL_35_11]